KRHPRIREMFRFHIETWCLWNYYPTCGDAGGFARPNGHYAGVSLTQNPGLTPSMYAFLWQLYRATGDAAFAQILHHANGEKTDGLAYDLFADDPEAIQKAVREVIAR